MPTARRPPRTGIRAPEDVLGYLLKHAHLSLEARTDAALATFHLTSRDLGALRVIAGGGATSQQDLAGVLGVDRSSMVALLDALERDGTIARKPSDEDRRRNIVEFTAAGRDVFERAEAVALEVERAFTAALGDAGAARLRRLLRTTLDD